MTPILPSLSRKPISFSPSSMNRSGGPSRSSSDDFSAGIQYSRISAPIGVPAPTLVSSAPSLTPRTFGGGPPPDLPQPHDSIDHRTPTVGIEPVGGYSSDLLSCVMAGAKKQCLWTTLQAHLNIVAVAALLETAAVIITENAQPDAATVAKANEQGVILLSSRMPTYEINGKLWELGVKTESPAKA